MNRTKFSSGSASSAQYIEGAGLLPYLNPLNSNISKPEEYTNPVPILLLGGYKTLAFGVPSCNVILSAVSLLTTNALPEKTVLSSADLSRKKLTHLS
jgi:hypothetical protein